MPAVPFARLISELEILYKPPHRRRSTWKKLRTVLREFQSLPKVRKTSDITPVNVVAWLDAHTDRAAITNKSYLSAFHQAVKYAKTMGYLRVDPWDVRRDWVTPDVSSDEDDGPRRQAPRHHPIEQIVAYMDLLDAEALAGGWFEWRLQAVSYVYALTALRAKEAVGLRKDDVDLAGRIINLKTRSRRQLKTRGSAQPVPIPPELHAVLSWWLPVCGSEWLFPARGRKKPREQTVPWIEGPAGEKVLDCVKAAGRRAGIPNLTIQSLRRSIATHGKRMGLSLMEVRDLLRHQDARTTQNWYIETDVPGITSIADRISYRKVLGLPTEIAMPTSREVAGMRPSSN